jgi:DMSO/TMAO reductase YedYZ heme-binding membrane subunit
MSPQFWWYLTRASGIVAWLMLTASVVWGIVLSTKAFPGQRRPAWLLDLHRWLGGLTLSFVVIHLVALVADSFVSFDLIDLTVPFASAWKPVPVGLGVVAMWLLIAVQATSLAMKRLPRRTWRWIHMSSYAVFFLTSLHAAFAGTDQSNRLYQLTGTVAIAAVTWATVYRLTHRRRVDPVRRAPTSRSHEREDDATDHGAFAGS